MRFSIYIGDTNIDLEGEPEEIIQILKSLNENAKEILKFTENAAEKTIDKINDIWERN